MGKRFQPSGEHLWLPHGVTVHSFVQTDLFALATFEACDLGHGYVATHHMLLVLEKQHGSACGGVLRHFGLDRSAILTVVNELDPPGPPVVLMGRLGYTDGLLDAARMATREAERLRAQRITVEHLLLAVADTAEGVVSELLARHGLQPSQLRKELLHWIGRHADIQPGAAANLGGT